MRSAQQPFVALVAVVALAMGIGFTTTMFSIVHGATRPLPFADARARGAREGDAPRGSMPTQARSTTASGRRRLPCLRGSV